MSFDSRVGDVASKRHQRLYFSTRFGSKHPTAKGRKLFKMRSNVLTMLDVFRCDERCRLKTLMLREQLLMLNDKLLEFFDLLALYAPVSHIGIVTLLDQK
jgi:hypothetical protein